MREQLHADLTAAEGRVPFVYKDSLGFWTIGVGHLVDKEKGGKLPDKIIDALLDYDIDEKMAQLDSRLPWWRSKPENIQRALVNMCFQLGMDGLLKFKNMLTCLEADDYAGAKAHALDSTWATQTPARAKSVTDLFA